MDILGHIHNLQIELERIKRVMQAFPPEEPCRDELEEIYESLFNIVATLNKDMLNLT